MRVWILSDIHLEFEDFKPPAVDSDIVVLAGDIHVGAKGLEWAREKFESEMVIYVLGNHEYYGQALPKHIRYLREASQGSNISILENEKREIGEFTILGCTLWTDFQLFGDPRVAGYEANQKMMDYRKIRVGPKYRKLRSADTAGEHHKSLNWLKRELSAANPAKTIVVTHHSPSPRSLGEGQAQDLLSAAYVSELSDFVAESGVPLWVHGHLHSQSDYTLGKTRVVCNPRGYPDESNPDFIPDLVMEL